MYIGTRLTTTPFILPFVITTIFFRPKRKNHWLILLSFKTPLMKPPHYYDQELWPHGGRIGGVPLYFILFPPA